MILNPTALAAISPRHHDMGLRTVYQSRYPKIDCHPLSSTAISPKRTAKGRKEPVHRSLPSLAAQRI
ncbi:hypothetical protein TNCV_3190581 [Trichonephila clavipes]|nr:hypothetical protein TNCV_3190581 [Trichonephila clavipes]